MKIIAINGSPRKNWNTATLLQKTLEGAASKGAETKSIHLYDLDCKGCISCFACKTIGGKSYGKCAIKDDLQPIFQEIENADALVLGAPIYFGQIAGEMQSFLERLLFPYHTYTNPPVSLFPNKIPAAFIYTMNVTEEMAKERGYEPMFQRFQTYLQTVFGSCETLMSYDTYQFKDYSKVLATRFDPVAKLKRKQEEFPKDCQKAFDLGVRLVVANK